MFDKNQPNPITKEVLRRPGCLIEDWNTFRATGSPEAKQRIDAAVITDPKTVAETGGMALAACSVEGCEVVIAFTDTRYWIEDESSCVRGVSDRGTTAN